MSTTDNTAIKDFANQLLSEKKIEGIDEKVLEQMSLDLQARIEDYINRAVVAALPEDKYAEFEKLATTSDQAQIQEYLQDNISDLNSVVTRALAEFRQTYLR